MSRIERREFLKTSTVTAAALGVSAFGARRVLGANDRLRCGVAGLRGRGRNHIAGIGQLPDCEVVALCDADESEIGKRAEEFAKRGQSNVSGYIDVRYLLDDESIDVLGVATPNHWHALMGIWACQAGKDLYIEKPCSHNVFEGRKLVEAARKYGRVVQHGTQIRSSAAIREAIEKLHGGVIGDVYMARGLCYRWRASIGKKPESSPPAGVNYDLWLGPAPEREFSENRFHYNWHWHWDYGNGDLGNQGVHQIDLARWGLGVGLPKRVNGSGGHFLFEDDQETPNVLVSTFEYPDEKKFLSFEVRPWMTNDEGGAQVGVIFYGSEGYMVIPTYSKYETFLGQKKERGPRGNAGGNHYENFVNAVRAKDPSRLTAEIEEGHLSSSLCHLGNISYRLGRRLDFDPGAETFGNDAEANALLTREYRKPYVVGDAV
ncbi:MAG: Gfo/Idh/MocA family oxidoreductase [Planctomycetota bacterium]